MQVEETHFFNREKMRLVADVAGHPDAPPALLLHGGGQMRASWKETVSAIAGAGFRAYALDARGHGESDRAPDGNYSMDVMADDIRDVVTRIGIPRLIIGASMGGIAGLLAMGEEPAIASEAIILVDVSPRVNPEGRDRVLSFMQAGIAGFDSLDEAADAVAAYNDNRRRPTNAAGLLRNLREMDGRYFWHWDPMFLQTWDFGRAGSESRLETAVRAIGAPMLLIHAGRSDVLRDEEAAHFQTIVPHAEYVRVDNAGHMVAGDQNELFCQAILGFQKRRFAAVQ